MNALWHYLFIPTIFCLLAVVLSWFWKPSDSLKNSINHLITGIIVSTAAVELTPLLLKASWNTLLIGFVISFFFMWILHWILHRFTHAFSSALIGLFVAAFVDLLIDGALMGIGFLGGKGTGRNITLALSFVCSS